MSSNCDWAHHGSITEASQAVDEGQLSAFWEVSIMTFPSGEQTETMRVALDLACNEFHLRETDDDSRERVARPTPSWSN